MQSSRCQFVLQYYLQLRVVFAVAPRANLRHNTEIKHPGACRDVGNKVLTAMAMLHSWIGCTRVGTGAVSPLSWSWPPRVSWLLRNSCRPPGRAAVSGSSPPTPPFWKPGDPQGPALHRHTGKAAARLRSEVPRRIRSGGPAQGTGRSENQLTMVFRVTPEQRPDEPVYFSQRLTVPAIEENAGGPAYLQRHVRRGRGQVSRRLADARPRERVCSSNWDIEAGAAAEGQADGARYRAGGRAAVRSAAVQAGAAGGARAARRIR